MSKRDRVIWCDPGWFLVPYGFCPSEAAWKCEVKRLGDPGAKYPTAPGSTVLFEHTSGKRCVLVTVADEVDSKDPVGIVGLLVHEATHVWQNICDYIGESDPGVETQAYAMQAISQELIRAYSETRRAGITQEK